MFRYPKRSYCILRNCIRLSDLVSAPTSNVFELERTADMRRLGMPVPQSWREFARGSKGEGDDFRGNTSSRTAPDQGERDTLRTFENRGVNSRSS